MNLFNFKQTPSNQAGLTLIELMVAMVISLLLIAGTITIFISNKQAYRLNEASSRVQENGRFALDFIRRDVRMAGYHGCVRPSDAAKLKNNVKLGAINTQVSKAIDGYDGTASLQGYSYTSGSLPADLTDIGLTTGTSEGDVVVDSDGNTDIIVVKRAVSCAGGRIDKDETSVNADFKITDNASCGFAQNEILMVSNCQGGDIFAVTNTPATTGKATLSFDGSLNTATATSRKYGPEAEIYRLQTIVYYIGWDGDPVSPSPSLFKRSIVGGAFINQELIEGVEDMTIVYGVDTDTNADGSANYYDDATQVEAASDWPQVISARIQVDVQSGAQNIVQSAAAGADRRLRHTFTETIRIRNSL
jgi:type IV pilus assembly protein PilW